MGTTKKVNLHEISNEFFFDFYDKKIPNKTITLSPYVHNQIIYCLNQQGSLSFDGQSISIPMMHLVIIRPQHAHSLQFHYPNNSKILHIGFIGDVSQLSAAATTVTHNITLLPLIQKEQYIMAYIFNQLCLGYPYIDDMLNALFVMICQQSNHHKTLHHCHPIIQRATCYIHDNFQQGLTIQEIAAHCATKPRYLTYLFRQELDITPSKYLALLRINTAKALLIDCSTKLEYIAHQIGYKNLSIFSKAFKRYTNYSPSEWRSIFYQPHL